MARAPRTESVEFAEAVRALEAWDGSPAAAMQLREMAASGLVHPGPQPSAAGRALQMAAHAYRTGQVPSPRRLSSTPELAAQFAPFLGDGQMGRWPFEDPVRIGDEDAAAWLATLRIAGHNRGLVCDEPMREFVHVFFRARPRELWMEAARTLATLALTDGELREWLSSSVRGSFPNGLPDRWTKGLSREAGGKHAARHALFAGFAFLAAGGSPLAVAGFSGASLAAMPLPTTDESDASVVLSALAELTSSSRTRAEVLARLPSRIAETSQDEHQEGALRELTDAMPDQPDADPVRAALERRLSQPIWMQAKGAARLDSLWCWMETARWRKARQDAAGLTRQQALAGEALPFLELALEGKLPDGYLHAVDAVLPRLRMILSPDVRATTQEPARILALAECLVLLELPELRDAPWPALVRRASVEHDSPGPGPVHARARADLALQLAGDGLAAAVLLRHEQFTLPVVLELARTTNGFLARQVALQLERLLRGKSGAELLRELWEVRCSRPLPDTFRFLLDDLRGEETPVHRLVQGLRALEQEARGPGGLDLLIAACGELFRSAEALVAEEPAALGALREWNASLLEAHRCAQAEQIGSAAFLGSVRTALFGDGAGGLAGWIHWCGQDQERLHGLWRDFDASVRSIEEAGHSATREVCDSARTTVHGLRKALSPLPLCEERMFGAVWDATETWIANRLHVAKLSAAEVHRCVTMLEIGDEESAIELASSPKRLERLPAAQLQQLNDFLLEHLRFAQSRHLRSLVRKRAALQPPWAYVAPLLAAVSTAPALLAGRWPESTPTMPAGQVWALTAVTLILALALLSALQWARIFAPPRKSKAHRELLSFPRRVLPLFGFVCLTALGSVLLQEAVGSVRGGRPGSTLWTLAVATAHGQLGTTLAKLQAGYSRLVFEAAVSMLFGMVLGSLAQRRARRPE
jgi:hypothetical protein